MLNRDRRPKNLHNSLRVESLEQRWVLSTAPILTVVGDQTVDEGTLLDLTDIGIFSDVVEGTSGGGGTTVGLDPNDPSFTSNGNFDPLANVVVDTTANTMTVDGNLITGDTYNVMADGVAIANPYEIAVFVFDDFSLDAGLTLSATGDRPLAILSKGDLTVAGTIDVSAAITNTIDGLTAGRIAGAGGGDGGGVGSADRGEAAAGSSLSTIDRGFGRNLGSSGQDDGGGGGAFGGDGGRGFDGIVKNNGGFDYGDLLVAIQGGSGGAPGFDEANAEGGGGGGGIELGAVGAIDISGQVLANGAGGTVLGSSSGGGGAGGGILAHAFDVTVSGVLSANGGNGGRKSTGEGGQGGGGGGGRILLSHDTAGTFDTTGATITALGGSSLSLLGTDGMDGTYDVEPVTSPSTPIIESYDFTIDWGDSSPIDSGDATIDMPGTNIGDTVMGSFDGSHTYQDNGTYIVTVSVISDTGADSSETTDTKTFTVTVNNVAPVLANVTNDSPAIGGAVEGEAVTVNADFSDAGAFDTHTASIDWGDGTETIGMVDQVAGTVTGDHVYADGGIYEITITLTDDDGGEAEAVTAAVVAGVGESDGILQFVGTNDNDIVKVFRHCFNGDYYVLYRLGDGNFQWKSFDYSSVSEIEMLLGDRNDLAFVSKHVKIDAFMDGGDGDDLLAGGGGDDTLIAGAGFDALFGGKGRDLMIGGDGGDLIFGEGGQDILISGTTAFDGNRAALDAIMDEWTSDRTYQQRSDNLRGIMGSTFDDRENDDVFLITEGEDATVFDDEAVDWLVGGAGKDLYFGGDEDVTISRFNEIVEEIEAEQPA